MTRHRLEIRVTPRPGILDPEGQAIYQALRSLGFAGAETVRVGKLIQVEMNADSPETALANADDMCRRLLANPVTEDYDVRLVNPNEVPRSAEGANS